MPWETFRFTLHTLKTWPVYFAKLVSGEKTFDVRLGDDRKYKVGDYVDFLEWDPAKKCLTGAHWVARITYVMHGPPFLPADTWALALKKEELA